MSALGPISVLLAIVFFGSNFLPVKKFDYGDGLFFQWVMCVSIWMVGLIVNLIQDAPKFEPYAMLGGLVWCTGNLVCVPVIRRVGLALGMLLWGGMNLIMGWASGVFGLLGVKRQTDEIDSWALNIIGVLLAITALAVSSQIRPSKQEAPAPADGLQVQNAAKGYDMLPSSPKNLSPAEVEEQRLVLQQEQATASAAADQRKVFRGRMEGTLMSLFAGCMFGISFNFAQFLIDKDDGKHSTEQLDYVFSHFSGILLSSSFYFLVYLLWKQYKRETPSVNPDGILGAIISGIMWGIAQTGWFMANGELSFVVTFPLIAVGPGFLACLWGTFLYKEITGSRNFKLLGVCGTLVLTCAICIVLSRK